MKSVKSEELRQKYVACMEEIKKRTSVVTAFVRGEINSKYVVTTAESAALQLRIILELIALSSLVANQEQYRKHRENFQKDWNAKRIVETLEKANPSFYPVPTKQRLVSDGHYDNPEIKSGYLRKEEFITLYDKCSTVLHATNPFSERENDMRTFLTEEVPEWMDKIIVLLNHHHVYPVDDDRMYIVLMQSEKDGNVHMAEFTKMSAEHAKRYANK